MTELDQLLHSDKAWVRTRAELALGIVNQRQMGEITADEAKELLEDLVRTDQLEAEADDMELKALLVSAVYGISLIV